MQVVNHRIVNDKASDRVRLLFLNNVTSSLYVSSLLLFYTLFFGIITVMYKLVCFPNQQCDDCHVLC